MLYIGEKINTTWQFDIRTFKKIIDDVEIEDIKTISASGHELGYILNRFKNIPMLSHKKENDPSERGYQMTWFGDTAKFIIANLI